MAAAPCVKSVARSALAAFAPEAPYLAAGTMAGAVDLSFSSSANLEIFNLDLQSEGQELPLAGACPSGERFHRLSWGRPPSSPSEDYALGLVAGGLVDGAVGVWNPIKLISAGSDVAEDALVARLEKHKGAVRGLEFCSLQPNLLASGAEEGELCIWDVGKPSEPNLFPTLKTGGQSEVSFVSWNSKFQPILASTSYNGVTVVWDLRQQKPVTSFSDSRRCTVLQWNPDMSTQLIIAADAGNSSSLRLWDVRRAIAPLKEFVGHTEGVIAMSWCPIDSLYLLTCAKDNRTICWDTVNGEIVRELPPSTSCNFDVHWCPKIPGALAASSFDVKIGIYNIEACSRPAVLDGNFQTPVTLRAPKWLKCPVGVSFGFGGKLVSFRTSSSSPGASTPISEVFMHSLVTESSLVSRSMEFEAAIQNGERASLRTLCEKKFMESESGDDKETWGFLKVMFEDDGTARTKLLAHLGFSVANESEDVADELGNELANNISLDQNKSGAAVGKGEISAFDIDNGEDFFNNPVHSSDGLTVEAINAPNVDVVPSELEEPVENPDSSFDESIRHALIVGNYKGAVAQCISANRMADALVIAHMGGASLWESTRDRYLSKSNLSYIKVVSAMVKNDLMALVNTRPLDSWKETLALLCTFAQKDEWTVLCDLLASRLIGVGNTLAATLCYICSGNINRTVEIWSRNLKAQYEGRSYVDLLQDLMEKTVVLTMATGQKQFTPSLSKLIENYAELLASQGLLSTAIEYLKLLGAEGSSNELDILRDRIIGSAEEEAASVAATEGTIPQQQPVYGTDQGTFTVDNSAHPYYQGDQPLPQQSISGVPYGKSYQQPFATSYGGYPVGQPTQQTYQDFANSSQIRAPSPMFMPSQPQGQQVQQGTFTPPTGESQPPVKFFVPTPAPTLKNVEQYQQNTLASHLYPQGTGDLPYQAALPGHASFNAGLSQDGPVPSHKFPQSAVTNPTARSFTPVSTPGFVPRSSISPVQSASPTPTPQVQSVSAAPAPQPTVQTVDTSNVSAELRPVIITLTRLYNETSDSLGGARANAAKKREIEDNSRKIGSLFAKLNSGDISSNAASKLVQLCQALDSGDYASALHIQVLLTTSDWDECNFWLAALKRMIKTRQTAR